MKLTWKKCADIPLRIMNWAVYLITILTTAGLLFYWKWIPSKIPAHWNGAGQIDHYGKKEILIMLVIMMYFFMGMHAIMMYSIPVFAYKENMFGKKAAEHATDEDLLRGTRFVLYLMAYINLLCEGIFLYIIVCGALVIEMGTWFFPVTMIALCAPIVYYLWRVYQLRNEILTR